MNATPELLLLMTTVPDTATAERLSAALIEQKLAACVQMLPAGQSGETHTVNPRAFSRTTPWT